MYPTEVAYWVAEAVLDFFSNRIVNYWTRLPDSIASSTDNRHPLGDGLNPNHPLRTTLFIADLAFSEPVIATVGYA
jgi:hypothetical protein